MFSKKFIKRLLRHPEMAKCPDCRYKMVRRGNYFICENINCGTGIDISDFYLTAGGKFRKRNPTVDEYKNTEDKKETIFVMNRFKLEDKPYKINETSSYNPVTRQLFINNNEIPENITDETKHLELIETIQTILNAK